MTPIVFKMRFTDPRTKRRSTPQRNASHVQYIGEREHALIAEKEENHVRYICERSHAALTAKQNGLFGKIRGEYSNSYDTADVQKYVREMSTTHRNIYWSVYSLTPESAAQAGLNSLKEWEDWVKLRTYEIAEHMKIRYDDLEYIAAVHLKEGQSHVHVGFWDKSQEIFRKTISPVIADNIRIDAIKHTFREQFNALHNRENELITQMRDITAQALSDGNNATLAKVQQMMNALKEKIPAKGRCAYQYMPQDIKIDLYNIMAELINNCEQLHALYADILDTRETYNELLHNDDSEWGHYQCELYKDKLVDEITNKMGNTILRAIVEQRRAERAEKAANHQPHNLALDVAMAALDKISGTNGLLGAADGAFILEKEKRTSNCAVLEISGSDQQEQMLYLEKNMNTLMWELTRAESELWKQPPDPLLDKVSRIVTADSPVWEGTATALKELLGTELSANALSRKLNINASRLWEEHKVRYEKSHGHDSRTIRLTLCDD